WRFLLSCVMLLIPTALMGATLPLLSAALLHSHGPRSTSVTRLYTRNLAGAICGTIVAGFFLLPTLGVRATIYIAALINILIGIVSIVADKRMDPQSSPGKDLATANAEHPQPVETRPATATAEARFWL